METKTLASRQQGWPSSEGNRVPLLWPKLIPGPGIICGLSLLFVLILSLRVILWVLQFSSLHKKPTVQIQIQPEEL